MKIRQKFEKVMLIAQKCFTVENFVEFICGSFWLVALRMFIFFIVFKQLGRNPSAQFHKEYFPFLFVGLIFVSTVVSIYALTLRFVCNEKKEGGLGTYEVTPTCLLGVLLYSFFIFVILEIIVVFPVYYLFGKYVLGVHIGTVSISSIIPLILYGASSLLILLGGVLIGCVFIIYYGFIPFDGWTSVYILNILSGAICSTEYLPGVLRQISILIPFSLGLKGIRNNILYNIHFDMHELIIYCGTGICVFILGLGCYFLFMQKARARGLL